MATSLHSKAARDELSAHTTTALRIVVALSLAAACIMVFAQVRHGASPLEALSEPQLKSVYLACSRAALEQLLGSAEIASCSMVYEALLKRVFGGDFHALLAWSRRHPDGAGDASAAVHVDGIQVP